MRSKNQFQPNRIHNLHNNDRNTKIHLQKHINQPKRIQPTNKLHKFIQIPFNNTPQKQKIQFIQKHHEGKILSKDHQRINIFNHQNHMNGYNIQRRSEKIIQSRTSEGYPPNSQQTSCRNSFRKIKIVSSSNHDKSISRSENTSLRKLKGIQIIKPTQQNIFNVNINRSGDTRQYGPTYPRQTQMYEKVFDEYQLDAQKQDGMGVDYNSNSNKVKDFKSIQISNKKPRINFIKSNPYSDNYQTPTNLAKVRSQNLIQAARPNSRFKIIGDISRQSGDNKNTIYTLKNPQKQIIINKSKTIDEMSLKQSLIIGVTNYYK